MSYLLKLIDQIDKVFLLLINHDSNHAIFDNIMVIARNPFTWIPLYLFMLLFVVYKTKSMSWRFIIESVILVAFTDSFTSRILKPLFDRPRPCYDLQIRDRVRSIVDCGGLYSFPSSHAANHFAMAAFWFWCIWTITGKKWKWLWFWAALVGYAQVYVGKHYPSDIIAGGLFGFTCGAMMAKIFEHGWKIHQQKKTMPSQIVVES